MANITQIVGATTASVAVAKQLVDMAPASGLSGIGDSITGAITNVGNTISKIFTTVGAGIVTSDLTLPLKNPLHAYASYNYIFSLSCLDADSFNYPASSYMAGNIPPLILKSGNSEPNNRINLGGSKYDFFLEDLKLVGQYGFEKGTGNVNTTNLEFRIIEPYSMGMFMIACQTAAYNQGYSNYREAPFLLIIQFRGNKETGVMQEVPYTTKFIPFNLNTIDMTVNEAGSVYSIVGTVTNAAAHNDSYTQLKSEATVTGTSVQEILQSGENSLQNVVNARYRDSAKDKTVNVPDEIVILFPQDTSTDKNNNGSAGTSSDYKTKSNKATLDPKTNQVNDPTLFKQLGVSRSSTNSALIQKTTDCNKLGSAKLGFGPTRTGSTTFAKDNAVYDEKAQVNIRANNVVPAGTSDFRFQQGSSIINAINQVLFKSDIATDALKPEQLSETGMRPWWRIDTQVYHIASNENMKTTGEIPKIIVYRVVPYGVHSSRMLAPNAPAPGIAELKKQVAKVYNYIYTGLNVDVLKFDIHINNTFYQAMQADNFRRTGDIQTASKTAAGGNENPSASIATPTSNDLPGIGKIPIISKFVSLLTSTDGKGGTVGENESTRAARLFHDSMLNGQDLMNITIDIVGDPYYIANSGIGNFTATSTNLINVSVDGNINYQNSEVDILINFRTPSDIIQATGMYNLNPKSNLVQQFSGLYKITTIESTFKNGQFTQTLTCNRRTGQDSDVAPAASSLMSTIQQIETNLGKDISNALAPAIDTINTTMTDIGNAAGKASKSITSAFTTNGG